jgi:hypothetical protein
MGSEIMDVPAPRVLVVFFMPVIRRLAQISRADGARVGKTSQSCRSYSTTWTA